MILITRYETLLNSYYMNSAKRLQHFFAQFHAENGGIIPKEESCYYTTVAGLRKTFYSPFKGKPDAFVAQYLRNSQKCANYVYAGRMGNGNEASGDGFKYRGRGFQLTGRDNYLRFSKDTGINVLKDPELLNIEVNAIISGLWYWKVNGLNKFADIDDEAAFDSICDIINKGRQTKQIGDAHAYARRKELLNYYRNLIKSI